MNPRYETPGSPEPDDSGLPQSQETPPITDDAARANAAREEVPDEEWLEFDEEEEDDDVVEREESAAKRNKSILREVAETLLLAFFIYFAVRSVVQNFKVEGSSMEPSLHHGEYLLVNKAAYMSLSLSMLQQPFAWIAGAEPPAETDALRPLGTPQRGDIVVFHYPRDPSRDFIKRVVALPGEIIEVRAGIVYVNNGLLEEPYVLENPSYSRPPEVVPEDEYFVLGDNRNNSSDSHVWGPVPLSKIVGKAWLTYWPVQDWGSVGGTPVLAGEREG